MAGMPLIAGFVSKFYMLIGSGTVGGGYWIFSTALIVSGVLNIAYLWPVVYTAFSRARTATTPSRCSSSRRAVNASRTSRTTRSQRTAGPYRR